MEKTKYLLDKINIDDIPKLDNAILKRALRRAKYEENAHIDWPQAHCNYGDHSDHSNYGDWN